MVITVLIDVIGKRMYNQHTYCLYTQMCALCGWGSCELVAVMSLLSAPLTLAEALHYTLHSASPSVLCHVWLTFDV